MAQRNFTGGGYARTFVDEAAGTKHIAHFSVPYIHAAGNYGSGDSYRAGVILDTRGYDYMYFKAHNIKWRYITAETNTALADVRSTLTAAGVTRGSIIRLANTTGSNIGAGESRGPREVKYWGSKSTEAGGTQIILERAWGRYPDPEFRADWSWWANYYGTSQAAKLQQSDGTAFGTDIVLNRNCSGNLFTNDVSGNDCINNGTAAHNWTLAQMNAFGRCSNKAGIISIEAYVPYYQGWRNKGGVADSSGIGQDDTSWGMEPYWSSDLAGSYANDSYLHNPSRPDGAAKLSKETSLANVYTGTAKSSLKSLYQGWEKTGDYYSLFANLTQNPGPYNTAGGTWMGKVRDLPDALWITPVPYNTSQDRKTATTGWTNNGGYTSSNALAVEAEDTNADGDTADTGEAASTVVNRGHDHLAEFDLHVSLHKYSSRL